MEIVMIMTFPFENDSTFVLIEIGSVPFKEKIRFRVAHFSHFLFFARVCEWFRFEVRVSK